MRRAARSWQVRDGAGHVASVRRATARPGLFLVPLQRYAERGGPPPRLGTAAALGTVHFERGLDDVRLVRATVYSQHLRTGDACAAALDAVAVAAVVAPPFADG